MKGHFLLFLLLPVTSSLQAQSKFGIVTYMVPANWKVTETKSSVVLANNSNKGSLCKVTLYSTENTGVTNAETYLERRTAKNAMNVNYPTSVRVVRTEINGVTGFYSSGTASVNGKEVKVYFFSYTNGTETFFAEAQTDGKTCTEQLNEFIKMLQIDIPDGPSSGHTRAKKRRAAPAAPAAPAPIM